MSRSRADHLYLRLFLGLLCIGLLVVSLLPLAVRIVHIGVLAPACAAVVGLAGCLWFPAFRRLFHRLWERKGTRMLLCVALGLLTALLLLFVVVSGIMLHAAGKPAPKNATVIVLGAGLQGDQPSLMLADRLHAAARYLEKNPDSVCVVSGGQGADEAFPEATVMKRYLCGLGIAESRVLEETRSTNTSENLDFSKEIIERENLSRTVVIATQEFHQFRARCFAKKAGLEEVGPCTCRTPPYLLLCYWVREFAGICRMGLLGY